MCAFDLVVVLSRTAYYYEKVNFNAYIFMNATAKESDNPIESLGRHLLIDFNNCDPVMLDTEDQIRDILLSSARACAATILEYSFHHFSPQGVSGVVLIAESHISIHTWPENHYAAVDIFTCGTRVDPYKAYEYIKMMFDTEDVFLRDIGRGTL